MLEQEVVSNGGYENNIYIESCASANCVVHCSQIIHVIIGSVNREAEVSTFIFLFYNHQRRLYVWIDNNIF